MSPMPPNSKVVRPGAGKALHVLGDVVTSLVVAADAGGAYAVQQQAIQPGGGPPLHRHGREVGVEFLGLPAGKTG
jgi:hypothetical protein